MTVEQTKAKIAELEEIAEIGAAELNELLRCGREIHPEFFESLGALIKEISVLRASLVVKY